MNPLNLKKSEKLWEEALDFVPGGVLGIRRPYNFVPGEYPLFLAKGKKGYVWDVDGNRYIDFLCAYGPIILGHREKEVDEAVCAQMKKGFCFNLCQPIQNELAKKMREHIPCAEQSFFVKTGSDATSSAIRIARGFTGQDKILRCGYHGWHDWCSEVHGGIPESVAEYTLEFPYNDLDALEKIVHQHKGHIAAIIITPIGHPLAAPVSAPKEGYLQGVRDLASQNNIVLIFDEIRTGFRVSLGGASAYYGVTPDMALFGKAMANGYPISAVCGKKEIMKVLAEGNVFISSTFFPNSLEMVAALTTIDILERENVCESIWLRGVDFLKKLETVVSGYGIGACISGIPPMPYITFSKDSQGIYKKRRKYFFTECIRRGLFMQPYHHSYIAHRHTDADLIAAIDIIDASLQSTQDIVG